MRLGTEAAIICGIRLGYRLIVRGGVRAIDRTVWYAGARGNACIGVDYNASTERNTLKAEKPLSFYAEWPYMGSINPTAIMNRQQVIFAKSCLGVNRDVGTNFSAQ